MAVRREVVSLSQLLQRRNSVYVDMPRGARHALSSDVVVAGNRRRENSQSLSQVSLSETNNRGVSSSASTATKRTASAASSRSAAPATGWGPFKDSRLPRDEFQGAASRQQPRLQPRESVERSGLHGFQSILSSQLSQSQTDTGSVRMLSQPEEVQEDSWNGYMTSQSQSQTFASQPLYQSRQPSIDIAYSQPQSLSHSDKFSRTVGSSGKISMESASERARDDDTTSRLVAPVTASLNELKAMLYQQNALHRERTATEQHVRDDVRSLKDAVECLHDYAKKTTQDCEGCHDKIAKEAAAAKCAFESMGVRMGAMEKNVDSFISNMSRFVREELFALRVEQAQKIATRIPPSLKQAPKAATKRRLMEETPVSRRYARIPTSTASKRKDRGRTQSTRGGTPREATSARRRSLRLERLRAKQDAEGASEDDEDDQFGMRLALERVEEARAKRLHQL